MLHRLVFFHQCSISCCLRLTIHYVNNMVQILKVIRMPSYAEKSKKVNTNIFLYDSPSFLTTSKKEELIFLYNVHLNVNHLLTFMGDLRGNIQSHAKI